MTDRQWKRAGWSIIALLVLFALLALTRHARAVCTSLMQMQGCSHEPEANNVQRGPDGYWRRLDIPIPPVRPVHRRGATSHDSHRRVVSSR